MRALEYGHREDVGGRQVTRHHRHSIQATCVVLRSDCWLKPPWPQRPHQFGTSEEAGTRRQPTAWHWMAALSPKRRWVVEILFCAKICVLYPCSCHHLPERSIRRLQGGWPEAAFHLVLRIYIWKTHLVFKMNVHFLTVAYLWGSHSEKWARGCRW